MGVVHKLKPEVLKFILENKQNNPALSCRNLTALIFEQLQIKVSKSSINAVFKENNLSMPIGRRAKPKKKKFNMPALPVIEGVKDTSRVEMTQQILREQEEAAARKKQEEADRAERDRLIKETEASIKQEEQARKLAEEKAAQELAIIKAQEEDRLRELEKATQELARMKAQEEARLQELSRLAQEAEEKRKREEEARRMAEEKAALPTPPPPPPPVPPPPVKEVVSPPQPESLAPGILPEERVCSGAMIIKAIDCLIGGSKEINAAISRATGGNPEELLHLTETLIFKSLFGGKGNIATVADLIGVRYPAQNLADYFAQIKQIPDIGIEVPKIISNLFTESKGVKVHFSDGTVIHLDGQLHSSWPGMRFPDDFSDLTLNLQDKLNKCFLKQEPLVLFSPPGYDILPKDFFNLILNIGSKEIYPDNLVLFNNKLEEAENVPLTRENRCGLIFGLWPWQFTSSRKVKKIGEFALKYIKELDRDLYLGEIEIDLFRVATNQSVTLKGCAVKTDLKEKIRLVILSSDQTAPEIDRLAGIYLSHWPNFEEAFQDFTRKIELFTYSSAEQKIFPKDSFGMDTSGAAMELTEIFANYVKILDAYLRWRFLPAEYLDKDLSSTSDIFYKIPAKLLPAAGKLKVKTLVSQDYESLKDLEYLNCRLNERKISAGNDRLFWFESAFK